MFTTKIFRALRYRNFRLYFCGVAVSWIGSWISTVALGWLVFKLSQSELVLGLYGFIGQLPFLFVAPLAGVLIDRVSKIRILLLTQTILLLLSFLLALLAWQEIITVWQIMVIALLKGTVSALDMPARQALVVDLIEDRELLPNAIALNSSIFNSARLIGPAIGGVLLMELGEELCFLVDGLSYFPALAALLLLRVPPRRKSADGPAPKLLTELVGGLSFAYSNSTIRGILLMLALGTVFGSSYVSLLPAFAGTVYNAGPALLGYLYSATGCGALIGALLLAARVRAKGLGNVVKIAAIGISTALLLLGLNSNANLGIVLMFVVGISVTTFTASCNTILQTVVSDQMRGRVMSLYAFAFVGMMPFGSLLGGVLASHFGVRLAVGACGAVCLLVVSGASPFLAEVDARISQAKGCLLQPLVNGQA